jgi:hypothetical protein
MAGSASSSSSWVESNEEYLQRHGLDVYVRDAWRSVVAASSSVPSTSAAAVPPRLVLARYFACVLGGTNVVGREYAYVIATRRNRLAFLRQLQRALWDVHRDSHVTQGDFLFLGARHTHTNTHAHAQTHAVCCWRDLRAHKSVHQCRRQTLPVPPHSLHLPFLPLPLRPFSSSSFCLFVSASSPSVPRLPVGGSVGASSDSSAGSVRCAWKWWVWPQTRPSQAGVVFKAAAAAATAPTAAIAAAST